MNRLCPIACLGLAFATGCNLAEPADQYEYQGPYLIITTDQGEPVDDMQPEPDLPETEDMAPVGSPELVFTELMIDTSVSQPGLGERGEYVEVKNVGDGPADPTKIVILIADPATPELMTGRIAIAPPATPEEIDVVSSLEPIEPGDYFVFVRFEIPEVPISVATGPGRSYDYGRFASGPALMNAGPRQLELRYNDRGVIETFDTVRWENGALIAPDGDTTQGPTIESDVALGVDASSETPDANDDPKQWCPSTETFGEGSALGTPGSPADCGSG